MSDGHDCHNHFEAAGIWDISDGTATFYGECSERFRSLRQRFDYAETVDDATGEPVHTADGDA